MIDRVIVIEVLVDREDQKPQIGQDDTKLGEEIIQSADRDRLSGE